MPLFYNRGADGLPRGWLKRDEAVASRRSCPVFNTNRMVQEYIGAVLHARRPSASAG